MKSIKIKCSPYLSDSKIKENIFVLLNVAMAVDKFGKK